MIMYTEMMKEMTNSRLENARNQAAAYRQVQEARQPRGNPVQKATGLISSLRPMLDWSETWSANRHNRTI